MKTKEEVLDFLQQNNCNQELINDVKGFYGYNWIALSYEYYAAEFTELALQQKQAKDGEDVYKIAESYVEHGVEFTELALQQEKAENGWDVYYIAGWDVYYIAWSYKKHGVEFTELALQHEKAENGFDVYKIAKEMFNEGNN